MEQNEKLEKKNKRNKRIIISSVIGGLGVGMFCIYKLLCREVNKEGSNLWYKYASLEELESYREKIGIQFKNAGLNKLSDKEYNEVERQKFKLDRIIGTIKNAIYEKEHPNAKVIHREHGWYLKNDD